MIMNEFDRIKQYFAPLTVGRICPHAPKGVRQGLVLDSVGLRDDCATVQVPVGYELVVNTDTLVSGVHFMGTESPQSLAHKILAVNLSDMVAKGAYAVAYNLAITVPPDYDHMWIEHFAQGLKQVQEDMGIVLLGGDSTKGATLTLTVSLLGVVPVGGMKRRCDARIGDDVWIAGGTIGDGYLGLNVAQGLLDLPDHHIPHVLCHYETPYVNPCLNDIIAQYAHGAMDISDGLVADAGHMASASAVAIDIWGDSVPLSQVAKVWLQTQGTLQPLLTGGDDYVVLMTTHPDNRSNIAQALDGLHLAGDIIGTVPEKGCGVTVYDTRGGRPLVLPKTGYTHF